MKINHVLITNWKPPGDKFWANASTHPDEPRIEATMSLTLSHKEYQELLARGREAETKSWLMVSE